MSMIQKALSSQQPRSSSFYYYYYHVVGVFIIITAFQDCSISSSNSKFDPFCVALKASNSQYSHSPTSQSTQPTWKLTMPSSAEAEANNDNDTDDTARFHHYAAAAVELSNAQVVVADDDITSTGTYAMLSLQRSVRNWDTNRRQMYQYHLPFVVPEIGSVVVSSTTSSRIPMPPPVPLDPAVQFQIVAPSGTKQVRVVSSSSSAGGGRGPVGVTTTDTTTKGCTIEVWEEGSLLRRVSSSVVSRHHGKIIHDPTGFGIPAWSPNESYLLYTAERLPITSPPLWGRSSTSRSSTSSSSSRDHQNTAASSNILGEGIMEGWGEQYVDQSPILDIYVLHVYTGKIERVQNVPISASSSSSSSSTSNTTNSTRGGVTFGQPVWNPITETSKNEIAYTAWDAGGLGKMPRRLGMVFCRNRPSYIYTSDITKLVERLASSSSASSATASNGGDADDEDSDFECITSEFPYARSPQYLVDNSNSNTNSTNTDEDGEQENELSSSLVFLASPKQFVSHDGCMGLYCHHKSRSTTSATTGTTDCIVPVIDIPSSSTTMGMGFPGLFVSQLPQTVQIKGGDNAYLVVASIWGSVTKLLRIHRTTKQVRILELPTTTRSTSSIPEEEKNNTNDSRTRILQPSCYSILTQTPTGDLIVSETALNRPARVWFLPCHDIIQQQHETTNRDDDDDDDGNNNGNNNEIIIIHGAQLISEFPSIAATSYSSVRPKHTMPFDVELLSIPIDDTSDESNNNDTNGDVSSSSSASIPPFPPIQALLCLPTSNDNNNTSSTCSSSTKKNKSFPLIVIPHGGPHSCSLSTYAPGVAFLVASGYAVVLPNYRGSTGFGQKSLESLLTNVGTNDVRDVMKVADHVKNLSCIDEKRIGICGGSHGGFLTGHCTGQYPGYFQAAVMRNPVTNIASMVTATDIPDWCYGEVFGRYDYTSFRAPTGNELQEMHKMSPVSYISNVKTPTLIALGLKDLRVPHSQGLEWYHTLRSAGVDTELLVYPEDNHALNKVATEADHYIHIKRWFDKYLG